METFRKISETEKEESEKEQIYDGLIRLYYYEAKARLGPLYDKHFSKAMDNMLPLLREKMEKLSYADSIFVGKIEKRDLKEKAALDYLYKAFRGFNKELREVGLDIESKKRLFRKMNIFINTVHNRMNDMHFGETFLGLNSDDFKALNYIDTKKPLEEQREIMKKAIKNNG